jgi:hypothetical protein
MEEQPMDRESDVEQKKDSEVKRQKKSRSLAQI